MTPTGQRGSALLAAVGVLSAMTLLATMSLLAGGADLAIASRRARQRSALYAAESALETTLGELAGGGLVPEASLHEPWPDPGIAVRRWRDGAWDCSRRVCLIPDRVDADGDPTTTVVLFNRSFGRTVSPLERGGSPVVQVLVAARSGESSQGIVAEVAPVSCAPRIDAAWMAAGALSLSGRVRVSGAATLPAVTGAGPVALLDGAAIEGESVVDPPWSAPDDVLGLLGAGGTLPSLAELPEPPAGGALRGLFWSRGGFSGPLDGTGVLVVHNPAFDPVKHEASRIAIEEGRLVEGHDPAYSHLDPSRQPARLDILGGGAFEGLIVADTIVGPGADFTLTGALVTLTRSPLAVSSSSALRVKGSRVAVERAGQGPLRLVTAFRPVAAGAGDMEPCP